jgi:hypothetical protein
MNVAMVVVVCSPSSSFSCTISKLPLREEGEGDTGRRTGEGDPPLERLNDDDDDAALLCWKGFVMGMTPAASNRFLSGVLRIGLGLGLALDVTVTGDEERDFGIFVRKKSETRFPFAREEGGEGWKKKPKKRGRFPRLPFFSSSEKK